jgi:hypothetical protein
MAQIICLGIFLLMIHLIKALNRLNINRNRVFKTCFPKEKSDRNFIL